MQEQQETTAAPFVPPTGDLGELRAAAAGCRGCELYKRGTQTVFGAGPGHARLMLVGEQPGEQEDVQGAPFVGPAGKMLDRALERAGLDRQQLYVTKAVKHFKWEPRGKRRIHSTPRESEVRSCRPWLEAEIGAVQPALIVALGSTAASAVFGPGVRVMRDRGQVLDTRFGVPGLVTVHPSALLRAPDEASRQQAFAALVRDLEVVVAVLSGLVERS
ncbi:MAG TPA: UdgX family uracil-DNA binding protein [Dehalococcoidia bacterium]|nr:UdgX family uracil-DNA binding protein [Dehalococcoidia bacterium]